MQVKAFHGCVCLFTTFLLARAEREDKLWHQGWLIWPTARVWNKGHEKFYASHLDIELQWRLFWPVKSPKFTQFLATFFFLIFFLWQVSALFIEFINRTANHVHPFYILNVFWRLLSYFLSNYFLLRCNFCQVSNIIFSFYMYFCLTRCTLYFYLYTLFRRTLFLIFNLVVLVSFTFLSSSPLIDIYCPIDANFAWSYILPAQNVSNNLISFDWIISEWLYLGVRVCSGFLCPNFCSYQ